MTVIVYERIHASTAFGACRSGALGGWGGGPKTQPVLFHRRRRTVASSVAARPIRVQPTTAHLRVHTRTTSDALCYSYCVTSTETALPSLAHLPQNEKLWIALGEFPNPTGTQVPDSRNPQRCNPCTHSDLFDGDHAKSVNDRAVLHLEIIRGLCR